MKNQIKKGKRKQYKSEKEFILTLCDALENSIFKQIPKEDLNEFEELMKNVSKEFIKRYPEEVKSKLISL